VRLTDALDRLSTTKKRFFSENFDCRVKTVPRERLRAKSVADVSSSGIMMLVEEMTLRSGNEIKEKLIEIVELDSQRRTLLEPSSELFSLRDTIPPV